MARIDNLDNFLTDIATAIRTKTEKNEQIPAEQFDQEILSIEGGIDTSDATATSVDILNPKTAYVNGEKITGAIQTLTEDVDIPSILSTNVQNTTGYTVLDISYTDLLILVKVSTTKVRLYKLNSSGTVDTSSYLDILTSDVVNVRNKNVLLDARFMYKDNTDSEIGIAFTVFTNYASSTWTDTYSGAIQYVNLSTFTLTNNYQVGIDFPADGGGNTGVLLPRPNNKYGFAFYGYFTTNGKQHCLLSYYLSNNELVGSKIFSTNWQSHGTTRFGSWTSDGELLYISDLTNTSMIYQVSSDNSTYTNMYGSISHAIPLSSDIGVDNSNQLITLSTNTVIKTLDFTLNYTTSNWLIHNGYLFTYNGTIVSMYKISADLPLLGQYEGKTGLPIKYDMVYIPSSSTTYNIMDTLNLEKTIIGFIRNNVIYRDTSDADASASDIVSGKIAYNVGGKVTGSVLERSSTTGGQYKIEDTMTESSYNSKDYVVAFSQDMNIQQDTLVRAGSTWDIWVSQSTIADAIGLVSGQIANGQTILGITGTYVGSMNGLVSFETKEDLLADTSEKENTIGLVQTFIAGDWEFKQNMGIKTFIIPKDIVLEAAPTEGKSYPIYYVNDTGDGPGQGPMTEISIHIPSTTDGIHYYIQEGDSMMGSINSWVSEDGINFTSETSSEDIVQNDSYTWYIGNEFTEFTEEDISILTAIIHELNYGVPEIYIWNGAEWEQYGSLAGTITATEYNTAVATTEDILGGYAITNSNFANTNTYTYPDYAIVPNLEGTAINPGGGGFEYYDENGELVSIMDGAVPLTTSEILKLFPYYAVVMRDELCMLLFADEEWTITVTDSDINYNGDNIGHCTLGISSTDKIITLEDMKNAEVYEVSHSYHGGAGGLGYSEGDSIAIYGNIKITDNTTNKIFS